MSPLQIDVLPICFAHLNCQFYHAVLLPVLILKGGYRSYLYESLYLLVRK
jgi:hypothetical protein